MQIVSNLGQFRANVNTEIQRMKDDRGNKKEMIETQIVTGLEMSFNLRMPVFKGSKPLTFRVDLCFEIRDSAVSVWMESPELAELTQDEVNRVIDEEVKFFQKYVVIEQ